MSRCFVGLLWALLSAGSCLGADRLSCPTFRRVTNQGAAGTVQVLARPVPGHHLSVCRPRALSCCSRSVEAQLGPAARLDLQRLVEETSHFPLAAFESQYGKMDDYMGDLLRRAEASLHDMFVRSYGVIYTQNADLFLWLFSQLRQYRAAAAVDLGEVMSEFWSQLLERMLQLLNPQYRFSDGDLECAVKLAESLRPFGAAPRKLLAQLGRAALAARSLTRGLRLAAGVANATRTVPLSAECVRSLVRLWYCPLCGGGGAAPPPCHAYCLNVLKGCLPHAADMDAAWNSFVDAMLQLTERLEGPFNVETVLAPIDVRISDAIMHLQENSVQVSTQIFAECGIPKPGRAHQAGNGAAPSGYGGRGRVGQSRPSAPTASPSTTIVHLVREARDTLRRMKSFWASLPFSVCNTDGVAAEISNEEECWNGEEEGRYLREVVGDGLAQQRDNPEVKVDVTRPDLQSRRQIMALRIMTNQLHGAFHGHDTHFPDSSDEWGSGSGDCGEETCPRPAEPPRASLPPSSGGRAHEGSPSRAPPPSSSRSALGLLAAALAAMLRRLQ
uniref:Glypican-6-like isoform X2 n=1 Tax=Petromyzon marinus TaxID=7757 RepID=A0AAJ7U7C0_PETMA|nr:glypican-6-like isoform X2 [Petromyzon marinus]